MHEEFEEIPFLVAVLTMVNYAIMTLAGHMRDFLRKIGVETSKIKQENDKMKVYFKAQLISISDLMSHMLMNFRQAPFMTHKTLFKTNVFCFVFDLFKFAKDFPPLYRDYDSFYTRNLYMRIRECWNRPICSVPGRKVTLMERETNDYGWNFQFDGI